MAPYGITRARRLTERVRPHWPALLLLPLALDAGGLSATSSAVSIVAILVAGAIAIGAPALGAKIVPFAFFAYGYAGIVLAHQWGLAAFEGYGGYPFYQFYGLPGLSATPGTLHYLLPTATAFLVAGLLLLARERSQVPGGGMVRAALRQLRGTAGQPKTVPALLLVPVTFLWLEFAGSGLASIEGLLTALPVLAGAVALAAIWPRGAAVLAIGLLLAFGYLGMHVEHQALANSSYTAPGANFYGAVLVGGPLSKLAGGIEGAALFGFGCFLAPRLLNSGTDAELVKRAQALAQRVTRLTQTRTDATETAVAELRRIERDLHDGAQARLVAVGMSLRAAEQLMTTNPAAARALLTEARETSSRALADLRDLVRGIYPPVLADRGLADAVRAIALDAALPVDVHIDLPADPPMPIAASVYFAIAEALTNAVRHSEASGAQVEIAHADGLLRATITDNGHGGADSTQGTGLSGVERRLATFDGILAISSPPGGPTILVIEVPCALAPAASRSQS
jgi:signal transduction histidine kinase